ncbi:transposase [Aquimarina intermedia]|uniref:transposase n=1 Tax=Aquimarina intermedia TaxID=350814 RepID=UPI0011E80F98
MIAILAGTKVDHIVQQLLKISNSLRDKVNDITLDTATLMKVIAKKCFFKIIQVTGRFHVQKLALEAL